MGAEGSFPPIYIVDVSLLVNYNWDPWRTQPLSCSYQHFPEGKDEVGALNGSGNLRVFVKTHEVAPFSLAVKSEEVLTK